MILSFSLNNCLILKGCTECANIFLSNFLYRYKINKNTNMDFEHFKSHSCLLGLNKWGYLLDITWCLLNDYINERTTKPLKIVWSSTLWLNTRSYIIIDPSWIPSIEHATFCFVSGPWTAFYMRWLCAKGNGNITGSQLQNLPCAFDFSVFVCCFIPMVGNLEFWTVMNGTGIKLFISHTVL